MSVFACRELADDFLQSPMAPVLTAGGMSSVNHDNYSDTDVGLEQLVGLAADEYPNVPPLEFFTKVTTVTSDATFDSAYTVAAPGEAIIIADGSYDWGTFMRCHRNFTVEDPIYILAETRGGVTFGDGTTFDLQCWGVGHVFGGFTIDSPTSSRAAVLEVQSDPASYIRFTSMDFVSNTTKGIQVYGACYALVGFEVDNCQFNSNNDIAQSKTHIEVQTRSGANSATVSNPRMIRMHHNIHRNLPSGGDEAAPIVLGTGYQFAVPANSYNPYNNSIGAIVENNTIDSCRADDEQIERKTGETIYRYNLEINCGGVTAPVLRLSDNSTTYGNWTEGALGGIRVSGVDFAMVFNYVGSSNLGWTALRLHGYSDDGTLLVYNAADRAQCLMNVFTRFGFAVQSISDARTTNPVGVLLDGNAFYSSAIPQTDVAGSGSYTDSGSFMTETEFRATNTWGTNTYSTTDLAVTNTKSASLFTGPGAVYTVPDPTVLWGQPSEIHAPSWWA